MVAAVFYTVVVEYVVSFIPALVNQFTINYRLRGLLANWMGWDTAKTQAENIFGSESASTHLQVLALMVIILRAVSNAVPRSDSARNGSSSSIAEPSAHRA